ncbi:MAG: thermonuclease family protein [Alphaproteobacteria bacterium]
MTGRSGGGVHRLATALLMILATGVIGATNATAQSLPGADPAGQALTPLAGGVVVAVTDGDTLALADGRVVRLVGIQAPKLALGRAHLSDWPLAGAARDHLAGLVLDRPVTLYAGGVAVDRHQRVLAHVVRDDGLWLQGAMLAAGLARVYTFADNTTLAAHMLALERAARNTGQAMWRLDAYAVLTPPETGDRIGDFALVEGTVLDAAVVRGRAFLNFGPDWRTDFTNTVGPAEVRRFAAAGIALDSLAGRRVRARGWLASRNGPQLELDHAAALEILPP